MLQDIFREDLRTGDILLVSRHKDNDWILSKGIKMLQGNEWHHAGIIVVLDGKPWIVEAERTGVMLTNLSHYTEGGYKCKILTLRDSQLRSRQIDIGKDIRDWLLPKCGRVRYDFVNLLGYQLLRYSFNWVGLKPKFLYKEPKRSDNRYVCSELAAHTQYEFFAIFDKWWITSPGDIEESSQYKHHNLVDNVE